MLDRADIEDKAEHKYKDYADIQQQASSFQERLINNAKQGKSGRKGAALAGIVSQNKSRFVTSEYNLDLSCSFLLHRHN